MGEKSQTCCQEDSVTEMGEGGVFRGCMLDLNSFRFTADKSLQLIMLMD